MGGDGCNGVVKLRFILQPSHSLAGGYQITYKYNYDGNGVEPRKCVEAYVVGHYYCGKGLSKAAYIVGFGAYVSLGLGV